MMASLQLTYFTKPMKPLILSILAANVLCAAEVVFTSPVGWNSVTCLNNSDTILGVPLRALGNQMIFSLSAAPTVDGDTATLTLSGANITANSLPKHYVKIRSGSKMGFIFDVTGNTTTTVTIALNGGTISEVLNGDSVLIQEHWTFDTLFPPSSATTAWTETPTGSGNFVQNGHAIVASNNSLNSGRKTEILLPNVTSPGIKLPAEGRYFIHDGIWKRSGSGDVSFGSRILYPDTLFTIRHLATVPYSTSFLNLGDVETGQFIVTLATQPNSAQDSYVAIPRPLAQTLEQLNLRQSPGAFVPSINTLNSGRRDQLLVYNNELQLRAKAPSATYYVHDNIWKQSGFGDIDQGSKIIPAAAGFIIRKIQVAGGVTALWNNIPSY